MGLVKEMCPKEGCDGWRDDTGIGAFRMPWLACPRVPPDKVWLMSDQIRDEGCPLMRPETP